MLRLSMILLWLTVTAVVASAAPPTPPPERRVRIEFYHQPGCNDCARVEKLLLPQLADEFPGRYELFQYDIGEKENFLRLISELDRLGIKSNDTVCVIIDRRIYLGGYRNIADGLIAQVRTALASAPPPETSPHVPYHASSQGLRSTSFTIGTVALAGFLDGINPCVFSTLVFFLSLLAAARVTGRKLLLTGSVYCLACFITYLMLGFGLFRILQMLSAFAWLRLGLDVTIVAILLLFAGISFADAWNYHRSRRPESVRLQLPERVKTLIHHILKHSLSYRNLLPRAFGAGMLVTVLEAVCTGQVYVPTLVLLSSTTGTASVWTAYLLLYNLMFIVPLLVLFLLFFWGTRVPALLHWSRSNVIVSKVLLGLFFLSLGATILGLKFL